MHTIVPHLQASIAEAAEVVLFCFKTGPVGLLRTGPRLRPRYGYLWTQSVGWPAQRERIHNVTSVPPPTRILPRPFVW